MCLRSYLKHEAPSSHPYGFEAIDELTRSLPVTKVFHGHQHHDRLDYSRDRMRLGFEAFGVGFCGVTCVNGSCIQPGKFVNEQGGRHQYKSARESMERTPCSLAGDSFAALQSVVTHVLQVRSAVLPSYLPLVIPLSGGPMK